MRSTKIWTILALLLCAFILVVPPAHADDGATATDPRNTAFEQDVLARLGKVSPDVVPVFQQATRDMDAQDLAAAKSGFEQVLALAPGFPDAERRLSYVERDQGNYQVALDHARRALAADNSAYSHSSVAEALLGVDTPASRVEALSEAKLGAAGLPNDPTVLSTLAHAALLNEDMPGLKQAATGLLRVAPQDPASHFAAGFDAAVDSDWQRSEAEFLLAERLGGSKQDIDSIMAALNVRQHVLEQRVIHGGIYGFITWIISGGLLFVAGIVLSGATMAAVRRYQVNPQPTNRLELLVRAIYRLVIGVTSLYFYVSIPFLIIAVIGAALGVLYVFLSIGHIPVQLMVAIGVAALNTVIAVVRSVFMRVKLADPGRPLAPAEAPQLWDLVKSVAKRVQTRPVDAIFITPGCEIGVMERGSVLAKLRGKGQRCLILGLGALPGMREGELEAILAHEYGHFTGRDTAGGDLALQVRASLYRMAAELAGRGLARWYNPAWLFINGFYRLFLRITQGASRLQEIVADRRAAMAYGANNFIDGLAHVVRQDLLFGWQADREIRLAVTRQRAIRNLYTLHMTRSVKLKEDLQHKLEEVTNQPTSPYDSHPSFKDRTQMAKKIRTTGIEEPVGGLVWGLLPNAEALQSEMTALVQERVATSSNRPVKMYDEELAEAEKDEGTEDEETDKETAAS